MRGNTRLEFTCGQRAIRLARKDLQILSQLARLAGTAFDQTLDHFNTLRERLSDADKERLRLEKQIAEREGRELYNLDGAFHRRIAPFVSASGAYRRSAARHGASLCFAAKGWSPAA